MMERYDIRVNVWGDVSGPQYEWETVRAEDGDFVLYADARATGEALQRERDELKELTSVICGHCCEPMAIPSRAVLQAALDAEREKVMGQTQRAEYAEGKVRELLLKQDALELKLSQLQALVRALVGTKSFTINGLDIRTMSGNVLYACSSQTSAERLGALLEYRERTLDATTPAEGGHDE